MQTVAYLILTGAFLFALFFSAMATWHVINKEKYPSPNKGGDSDFNLISSLGWTEKSQLAITALLSVASLILLNALATSDFSFHYVYSYTDLNLPKFYKLTAFWAGQSGSMLFWAWSVAIFGVFFLFSKSYTHLTPTTKMIFWALFLSIMGFFLLILTGWSNPFITFITEQSDGKGLNPLLQHPGMIFHPPLLFLGYGGFVIPGCLALAQFLSGKRQEEGSWIELSRPFILIAWLLLTAGIVLGAWWAYMELGWGGYWAWDPVENASLIPWLIATAFIHTSIIETRRNKLHRTNAFLISLTTISAFFATYLVRSGIVESVHAFGDGGVGTPLLSFILISTFFASGVAFFSNTNQAQDSELAQPFSKEGLLLLTTSILLLLSLVITLATLWPVLSEVFSGKSMGLDASFYNKVCLPFFSLLALLLVFCPWIKWKGGIRNNIIAILLLLTITGTAVTVYMFGYKLPSGSLLPHISVGFAVAIMLNFIFLYIKDKNMSSDFGTLAAHGIHFGLALIVLGIAMSGPFKEENQDVVLNINESFTLGGYSFTLKELNVADAKTYSYLEAVLAISKDGKELGIMRPEQRRYHNFGNQTFLESDTLDHIGQELYASVFGVDEQNRAVLNISLHPMVNLIWIGGVIMSIFPILGIFRRKKVLGKKADWSIDNSNTDSE
ncbi:heme lyase CcmF/NrfE family subunit [Desulfovibrio litoralis]|uniref:Cytochrome c-type biogenesis protein CcmF n=1 Tax=Desulfovibrio litoralis DSM 11393 TaxID=1121455 RepID=A0A1M7RSS5_9BACT|nr:cytochrome c-type biogenesis CcmF C-terminal domain-containing protein [Desulfovibrio litoralis]SHN49230.1 cytochrome c-type biogenesis protein CcmF [Desulfovibrio litoralis DSM 11393]